MPNWAWGIMEVRGEKEAVRAFSGRLIMEDEPVTLPGVRYFGRTFTGDTRAYIGSLIREAFRDCPENAETECVIPAAFAWSARSCLLDGWPQRDPERCISLRESCIRDSVDVTVRTKETGSGFEETITCDRHGHLEAECKDLQSARCMRCGAVSGVAAFEEPAAAACGECGYAGLRPAGEGERIWH